MKKLFKFLLILLIWGVIAAASVVGALLLGEDWDVGLAFAAVLFVLWLVFLGLRKLWVRWRAKRQVEQLVNVEQPAKASRWQLPEGLRFWRQGQLERRFKRVMALLRRSRLKDQGDPVYVLPWLLLLGHDGAGKTTFLRRARLPAPTIDDEALRRDDQSVAWWLTNEAVLLDAPGAYVSGERRHPEWPELLGLLARYREKEPLNGVVVALPAERLLSGDADDLFEYGRGLRKRIDELQRALKLRLPVYVLVTKADQIAGFSDWCAALPRDLLDQPMGHADSGELASDEFVRQALGALGERIQALLLPMLNARRPSPDLLRMTSALERLRTPLVAFSDGLFQGNAYEESPLGRGLYFTGGFQPEGHEGEPRQVFVQELFTRLLPGDRAARSTLSSAERAEQVARRLALSGWGIALALVCLALGSTYVRHAAYLKHVADDHAGKYVRVTSLGGNIDQIHALREMIREVEDETGGWWTPWFGLPGAGTPNFVEKLHGLYLTRFREDVLNPVLGHFDAKTNEVFYAQLNLRSGKKGVVLPTAAGDEVALYVGTVVRRINILNAYLDGADEDQLLAMPGPFEVSDLFFAEDVAPTTAQKVNVLYVQALIWSGDTEAAKSERDRLRAQLVTLLQMTGKDLGWLIPWANEAAADQAIVLTDFWTGSGTADDSVKVPAAFTLAGKEAIDGFFSELQAAGLEGDKLEGMKAEFDRVYRGAYLQAWRKFALEFDRGREVLRGRGEWVTAVDNLAGARSPYLKLLDTMGEQLAPVADGEVPDWVTLVAYYHQMRDLTPTAGGDNKARNNVLTKLALRFIGKAGAAGKAVAGAGKETLKVKKQLDKATAKSGKSPDERAAALEEAAKALGEYDQALVDVAFNSDARSVSYAAVANLFTNPDNPGKGDGPEARAHATIQRLQTLIGKETEYNRPFWRVFAGPLSVIQEYTLEEAACYLQEQYQNKFLTQIEGVSSYKLGDLMFGPGGKLWTFIDADLKPFVQLRPNAGYVPARAGGERVPLTEEFLEFASKGRDNLQAKKDKYPVVIESLPTSANADARFKPSKTSVILQCEAGEYALVNYNFPAQTTFNWNDKCGNVILSFDVGRYTLEKVYEGGLAFPEFLKDFRTGKKRFLPSDFPEYEALLEEFGIQYLDAEMKLKGHGDVIRILDRITLTPPADLAVCWD